MNLVVHFTKKGVKHAIIDVDNTISKSNVVEFYLFVRSAMMHPVLYRVWLCYFMIVHIPRYLLLDFWKRERFQQVFYRNYANIPIGQLERRAYEFFEMKVKSSFIQPVHDLIFDLKRAGISVVLLSTSIEPIVKQYADYFQVPYVCLEARSENGATQIDLSSLSDFKLNYIRECGCDPCNTVSIADSKHDFDVLNYPKYAVVVNNRVPKWMKGLQNDAVFLDRKGRE